MKTGKWSSPKKGTPQYDEVIEVQRLLKEGALKTIDEKAQQPKVKAKATTKKTAAKDTVKKAEPPSKKAKTTQENQQEVLDSVVDVKPKRIKKEK